MLSPGGLATIKSGLRGTSGQVFSSRREATGGAGVHGGEGGGPWGPLAGKYANRLLLDESANSSLLGTGGPAVGKAHQGLEGSVKETDLPCSGQFVLVFFHGVPLPAVLAGACGQGSVPSGGRTLLFLVHGPAAAQEADGEGVRGTARVGWGGRRLLCLAGKRATPASVKGTSTLSPFYREGNGGVDRGPAHGLGRAELRLRPRSDPKSCPF